MNTSRRFDKKTGIFVVEDVSFIIYPLYDEPFTFCSEFGINSLFIFPFNGIYKHGSETLNINIQRGYSNLIIPEYDKSFSV